MTLGRRFRPVAPRRFWLGLASFGAVLTAGCHSAFVQATVVNHTDAPLHLFEVDYPSASFGGSDLAPGAQFHYRFKILGSGPSKLTWTDAAEHDHTSQGPALQEGQEGTLLLTLDATGAHWNAQLHPGQH